MYCAAGEHVSRFTYTTLPCRLIGVSCPNSVIQCLRVPVSSHKGPSFLSLVALSDSLEIPVPQEGV